MAISAAFLHQPAANHFFSSYWVSGRAAAHGLNPYAVYPETYLSPYIDASGAKAWVADVNLNPPLTLLPLQLLSRLPLHAFAAAWLSISLALLFATVALLVRSTPFIHSLQVVWLLLAGPVINALFCGQIYLLLLALSALAWWCGHRNRIIGSHQADDIALARIPFHRWAPACRIASIHGDRFVQPYAARLLPLGIPAVAHSDPWRSPLASEWS
jgi:hypothetical protein